MNARIWMVCGAVLAALGVGLGAYHAHGLQAWLQQTGAEPEQVVRRLQHADVAVRYQLYHALGLLILGQLLLAITSRILTAACILLTVGIVLFSGGLYVMVFAGTVIHWAIVPSGGVLLIVGWIVAAAGLATVRREDRV